MPSTTVLIIDADEANRHFIAQMLQKRGYPVLHAANGQEGIATVNQRMPDVIILDASLPDYSVLEMVQALRQEPHIARIPVAVLSSKSDPDEMERCMQAGANEYFVKSGMAIMAMVDSIPRLISEIAKKTGALAQAGLSIVFLSAKGGTGTSSLCANIGMNIATNMPQSTVCVADMVLPIGSIANIVGYKDDFNLMSLTEREPRELTPDFLRKSLTVPGSWSFHLMAGSPDPETAIQFHAERMPDIAKALTYAFDYVLIDLGRSLSRLSLPIIKKADVVVLVVGTDQSTINLTRKVWGYLEKQGLDRNKVYPILNRAVGLEGLSKMEAEKIIGIDIRLTMPYLMGNFTLANNQNTPITVKFPMDTASMIFKQAAIEISQMAIKTHNPA